jgi:aspartate aminotransferase
MFEEGIRLRAQHGADKVCDLSIGNPDLEPPALFYAELKRLAEDTRPGLHRYMPNAGFPETRAAVASLLAEQTGVEFAGSDVIMTCGTAGALNCTFKALLDPGDEVIALAPYFFEYEFFVDNYGGTLRVVPCLDDLTPDLDALAASISPKTKALIVNSPNNPSGIVYSDSVLRQISAILTAKAAEYGSQIYAVSDDVYCRVVFDGLTCPRIVGHYPDTVIVSSFSKDLSLPGERIGYAAVSPACSDREDVAKGIIYAVRVLGFVSAPALQQRLVTGAMGQTVDVSEYEAKRDFMYDGLTRAGYSVVKPQGAFYIFPKTPTPDCKSFCGELQQELVLAVPGFCFGAPGHFRLSYCVDGCYLERSLAGLEKVMARQGNAG